MATGGSCRQLRNHISLSDIAKLPFADRKMAQHKLASIKDESIKPHDSVSNVGCANTMEDSQARSPTDLPVPSNPSDFGSEVSGLQSCANGASSSQVGGDVNRKIRREAVNIASVGASGVVELDGRRVAFKLAFLKPDFMTCKRPLDLGYQ